MASSIKDILNNGQNKHTVDHVANYSRLETPQQRTNYLNHLKATGQAEGTFINPMRSIDNEKLKVLVPDRIIPARGPGALGAILRGNQPDSTLETDRILTGKMNGMIARERGNGHRTSQNTTPVVRSPDTPIRQPRTTLSPRSEPSGLNSRPQTPEGSLLPFDPSQVARAVGDQSREILHEIGRFRHDMLNAVQKALDTPQQMVTRNTSHRDVFGNIKTTTETAPQARTIDARINVKATLPTAHFERSINYNYKNVEGDSSQGPSASTVHFEAQEGAYGQYESYDFDGGSIDFSGSSFTVDSH